ncbi:integrase [Rhodoligotrophos appendicifer]|uniref:site-specific integrase n=1 Tax=Rhodoligotrophos appendicifer TaxID=987056 RepID=UPI001FE999BF|nr:site-specific integrase [Rhodoligotrophos appendicifer]
MELNKLHLKLSDRPYRANRVLAYLGSVYGWGAKHGFVPKNFNPVADIERFREQGRERFLTSEELGRLGAVLRQAETEGLPWSINVTGPKSKHLAKVDNRNIVYPAHTIAAIRLLIVTGCRLREILNLRWDEVDFGRGLLFLADSKTGRKPVILNGAAIEILKGLDRVGDYVVAGQDPRKPRRDLKRPWDHIREAANLNDVRLHDLRHTHASIGASAGFGLQIVGKLLGHSSPLTTQRYAHLADDPVRRASEAIGRHLTEVMAPVPDALKER